LNKTSFIVNFDILKIDHLVIEHRGLDFHPIVVRLRQISPKNHYDKYDLELKSLCIRLLYQVCQSLALDR